MTGQHTSIHPAKVGQQFSQWTTAERSIEQYEHTQSLSGGDAKIREHNNNNNRSNDDVQMSEVETGQANTPAAATAANQSQANTSQGAQEVSGRCQAVVT